MADGNSHPFNSDVIASETFNHIHKQSSSHQIQLNTSKNPQQKLLLDLLSANHTSNHFFNSNDPSLNIASPTISDDDFNRLKILIRSTIWPVDHSIRRQLWMNILTFNRNSSTVTPVSPTSLTIDHHFNNITVKTSQWPNFVDTTNLCFYHLNDSTGRSSLQRILFAFALHHPDLTYCPALEPFSALLLHYFNENEVLFLINRLLQKHWLCGETRLQWEANSNVFRKLLKTFYKSNAETIDLRYANSKSFYSDWFWWIFRYLPFPHLVKILDCFFLEGPKILYRVGLALVHLYMKILHTFSSCLNTMFHVCPATIKSWWCIEKRKSILSKYSCFFFFF